MVTLEVLTAAWKNAKKAEQVANVERLEIEEAIVKLLGDSLKEKGTNNLSTGLKIVTGYTQKWNQDKLCEIHKDWPDDDYNFPFNPEWKPDTKGLNHLIDNNCDIFNEFLSDALTVTPSKPSFSYVEKKNE